METRQELYARMADAYTELTGATPDDASDVGIRMRVLAGELAVLQDALTALEPQLFPATSTGVHLERHAQARGLHRKGAVAAAGMLRFSRSQPAQGDIPLPKGLLCATSGEPVVRFVTTEEGILPAGSTQVSVSARAQEGGILGNAAASTVTVMLTPAAGIGAVSNSVPFTGGAEEEGDDALRQRLLESYRTVSNGTNTAFYRQKALSQEGVSSVKVLPRARGIGTVDLVVTDHGASPAQVVLTTLQTELKEAKELNVDVSVYPAEAVPVDVSVTVQVEPGVDRQRIKEQLEVRLRTWMAQRPVGEPLRLAALYALLMGEGPVNAVLHLPTADRVVSSKQVVTLRTLDVVCEEAVG